LRAVRKHALTFVEEEDDVFACTRSVEDTSA
jgi:hypothetical protein